METQKRNIGIFRALRNSIRSDMEVTQSGRKGSNTMIIDNRAKQTQSGTWYDSSISSGIITKHMTNISRTKVYWLLDMPRIKWTINGLDFRVDSLEIKHRGLFLHLLRVESPRLDSSSLSRMLIRGVYVARAPMVNKSSRKDNVNV